MINVTEKTVFKITGSVVDSYKNCVCSFSPDGYYFASAERSHPATVNVYTTDNWTKIQVKIVAVLFLFVTTTKQCICIELSFFHTYIQNQTLIKQKVFVTIFFKNSGQAL